MPSGPSGPTSPTGFSPPPQCAALRQLPAVPIRSSTTPSAERDCFRTRRTCHRPGQRLLRAGNVIELPPRFSHRVPHRSTGPNQAHRRSGARVRRRRSGSSRRLRPHRRRRGPSCLAGPADHHHLPHRRRPPLRRPEHRPQRPPIRLTVRTPPRPDQLRACRIRPPDHSRRLAVHMVGPEFARHIRTLRRRHLHTHALHRILWRPGRLPARHHPHVRRHRLQRQDPR
jgi:hypothetical protein